jgi:hypothetical protein
VINAYSTRVSDLAAGQQQAELTGHDSPVMAVAVTTDGPVWSPATKAALCGYGT